MNSLDCLLVPLLFIVILIWMDISTVSKNLYSILEEIYLVLEEMKDGKEK